MFVSCGEWICFVGVVIWDEVLRMVVLLKCVGLLIFGIRLFIFIWLMFLIKILCIFFMVWWMIFYG